MQAIDMQNNYWNNSDNQKSGNTVSDLGEWVRAGFDVLDFPLPEWIKIDCNMARSILNNAGIK